MGRLTQMLVSPATRLGKPAWKATKRPSALIDASAAWEKLKSPLPWMPSEATLTRVVWALWRSRTKMSLRPLVSPGTKLVASDSKAT